MPLVAVVEKVFKSVKSVDVIIKNLQRKIRSPFRRLCWSDGNDNSDLGILFDNQLNNHTT